ncbi:hypothetical protein L211DRAFT_843836 [Terfezia boudieri ATCC MYA-4762]|uniref:Uncharacterized protein n=1 Tax=Terfezia boudieri ATCC MYA-4762 TaxID=1051890 RepID=A0A3N4L5S9_9PEZI|nr:hypothetical protein L211DRAFT_843836 [Terfezia boudieri ATCC MYA-4762]
MPQTRSQTVQEASAHQKKESDSRDTTPALLGHDNPSHYSGTHSSAEHSGTHDEVDLIGVITEFRDYMEKVQHRIGGQPHESRSKKLDTLGLLPLVGHITEIMQHRVISDLEDEEYRLKAEILERSNRVFSRGDPGLPLIILDTFKVLINRPSFYINSTMLHFALPDVQWTSSLQWTMSNTWGAIWKMLPEDTDGILARMQENIYFEAFKPCDVPYLEIYLPRVIISATVLPIAFDFDHCTINFLGDDKIQQCIADLQKSIIDNTDTTPSDVHNFRAYTMFALRKNPQRFELERAKTIDALARTLHTYLRPLGTIERMEDHLRDVIRHAAETGLELAQFKVYAVVRRNGCRPGDHFDPRLMTAAYIPPRKGMESESELVTAGARVAIVLSPLLVQNVHNYYGQRCDVENMEVNELSNYILEKGNVVCYIVKEGRDGEKSVEFPMDAAKEVL